MFSQRKTALIASNVEEFSCATVTSRAATTRQALAECLDNLREINHGNPSWILTFFNESHDATLIANTLSAVTSSDNVHGGTSCKTIMSSTGVCREISPALGIFAIFDPDGAYGIGGVPIGEDPREAAAKALQIALQNSGRPDETPGLVWISAAPGAEEELLCGIADVIGSQVPVAGGSSADNNIAGLWKQVAGNTAYENAVVISVLFPSVDISYSFHSGYDPTENRGVITRAHGRRVFTIDDEPAAAVYNRWSNGRITQFMREGGNILQTTSMAPLGKEVIDVQGIRYYNLLHPETVDPEGTMTFFAEATEGTEVVLMDGCKDQLVRRAGRVARAARDEFHTPKAGILGGLVVYCAGCMLAIEDRLPEVGKSVNRALGNAPFLGIFTFGEQGCHFSGENAHGNLMISVVLFRKAPAL